MPGIAGIIHLPSSREAIEYTLGHMMKLLNHTSPCIEETFFTEGAAFCAVRIKNYPFQGLIAEDEKYALAFWGYLWDEKKLRKESGQDIESLRDILIGQFVLEIYRKKGMDGLYKLNGRFVIAIWDKHSKNLKLISDRYGFTRLYCWISSEQIMFASEYKAIIWHKDFFKKIDEQGLADFMALGYSTEDRTFFENIKLLPPASVVTFERDGNLSIQRYWDYSFHSDEDPLWLEEDYVDQFAEILTKATQRQIDSNNNIGLPLSGGFDSRTLAGMLKKIGFEGKVKAFSYGNPHAYDVVYGRKIAKHVGYEHSYIPIESTYLRDHAEKFVWLLEGTVDCLNAHMLLTYPFIRENSLDTIMTGFFGDIICGSAAWIYSVGIRGGTDDKDIFRSQYDVHASIMKDKDMAVYMNDQIYQEVKGKTFEILQSKYFQCPSRNRYFRSRYFSTHERQRRYTSFNLYIFDYVANVVSPFLDYEFVDFVYHIPSELIIFQNVYRKMIVKHLPKVASVPHNETRLPLNASWIRKGLHWRWERLLRNPLVRATIGRKYVKVNDNYLNTDIAIRTGSRDFVINHVRNNAFLAEYFNMDRVHQILDDHMSGKSNEYGKITALLTLSLWHKLFIKGEFKKN